MDWAEEIRAGVEIVPQRKGKFHVRANSRIVQNAAFAYVELTQGEWARIDAASVPLVKDKPWSVSIDRTGVKYARAQGGRIKMHKIFCPVSDGMHVDHVNGNGLDNVSSNLRAATPGQNQMNKARQKNSKYGTGVTLERRYGTFRATISVDGKQTYLGSFKTAAEARSAYEAASLKGFGQFSYLARASQIERGET
jgi:hypothetical protein